jgi:hypothetical protein
MTQATLPLEMPRKAGLSLADRLAAYFTERPNVWIDGRELGKVAGAYAWRTRCSDLRHAPYQMTIENQKRFALAPSGVRFTVSEYRYVPAE